MDCPDVANCRDKIYKAIGERVKWFHVILMLSLLGTSLGYWNATISEAQDRADAAIVKTENESREKDKEQDKTIQELQLAVKEVEGNTKRIEEKVDKAIEDSDKKQEEILKAIDDLKKNE